MDIKDKKPYTKSHALLDLKQLFDIKNGRDLIKAPSVLHSHQCFEIEYIASGEAISVVNGSEYRCSAGTIFFFTPMDFHQYTYAEKASEYCVGFQSKVLDDGIWKLYDIGAEFLTCKFEGEEKKSVEAYFSRLFKEYAKARKSDGDIEIIKGLISSVVMEMLRCINIVPNCAEFSKYNMWEILSEIRYGFRGDITLGKIARKFYLSPNYLSYLFSKQLGISFQQYLMNMRLEYAGNLLKVTTIPVAKVCMECGFYSLSYFYRAFKKKYQCTPAVYRRRHIKD